MSYVLGVSSGAFGVTSAEERPQLAGLFRKAQTSVTKGVNFVQLDLESLSEFSEPDLDKRMENDIREKLHIEYGIHSETKAFGVEAAELDSAIGMEYGRAHRRIEEVLEKSKKIKAKYVLIHSSESEPFPLLEKTLQSTDLVDPDGNKLSEFLKKDDCWLLKWLFGVEKVDKKIENIADYVYNLWISKPIENGERRKLIKTPEAIQSALEEQGIEPKDFIWYEISGGSGLSELLRREIENIIQRIESGVGGEKYENLDIKTRNSVDESIKRNLNIELNNLSQNILSFIQSKNLHYGPERLAYYFVAKWMEKNKDTEPLWEKIINASIKFFASKEKKTVEEWMEEKKIKSTNLSIDDDTFRSMHELWVPAVSARYIYGHFFPKEEYEDLKKNLSEEMIFALESPMGGRGIEEWLRLGNPYMYYFLVEEMNEKAGKEIFTVAMDFEHMLSLRVDPETVIELLPEDGGKHVRIIHAGWPSTLAPAHLPIEIGSNQQKYLYEMYYKLREKGFGKDDKEYFVIFERGGPETFQQSIVSLKLILKFLEQDVSPKKLPPEFYGVATGEMASPERQSTIIREHAADPLKGLIVVPEEEHGFLGRAAVEKGKAEEWKKEKYR